MRRSSIFNFETYQAQWRVSYWIILLMALILLSELLLRSPAMIAKLPDPEPTLWHAELIQRKMDYLKAFEAERGIDVLFIGNSTAQSGFNPSIFDAARGLEASSTSAHHPGSFNASIEGLPPYGMLLFLEGYLHYIQPKTIIYGITPQDLNSNSPWARDVTDRVKNSPMPLAQAQRGIRGWFIANLLKISKLYRYRHVLHQLILRGGEYPEVAQPHFDERGFHGLKNRLADVPPEERYIYLNNAGVLNYRVYGEQIENFKRLLELCRAQDIKLILVNMPLADDYYANFDSLDDYQTYLAAVHDLTTEFKIPFWDPEAFDATEGFTDVYFSDFNHLNVDGAEKLSIYIAGQYVQTVANNRSVIEK